MQFRKTIDRFVYIFGKFVVRGRMPLHIFYSVRYNTHYNIIGIILRYILSRRNAPKCIPICYFTDSDLRLTACHASSYIRVKKKIERLSLLHLYILLELKFAVKY